MPEAQAFAEAARAASLPSWPFPCPKCSNVVGFEFNFQNNPSGEVWFNADCACKYPKKYHYFKSSWQAVADRYFLDADDPEVKELFDKFWNFSEDAVNPFPED